MIELIQFPWSPFCIVQRRILEFSRAPFKIINIPSTDRTLVWKLTKQRYYGVPIIKDGRQVIFEVSEESQVVAKYLNERFSLGLFPQELRGVQSILWGYIENEIEGPCFKLNDIHWQKLVPKREQLAFLRHKERKFGRGCIDQWREQQDALIAELSRKLVPFEQMLVTRTYLLDMRPRFIDFNLFGMLSNLLYTGHYKIPEAHTGIEQWYERMSKIKLSNTREKLRS
ncbi:MAG: glutathione S-transferase N-terminal domain-containing protein [Verrucomicrobia bacterium]|nr:glutathione S-transferase N-terminal domain-containing protein [Verrucomicrobiota bacterium]